MHFVKGSLLFGLMAFLPASTIAQNIVSNPTTSQTINQPTGTTFAVQGAAALGSMNGDLWVGSATGQYSSISAAVSAATSGSTIHIQNNFTDTLSSSLTINKDLLLYFHGCSSAINLNGTNQLLVSAGIDVSIVSDCPNPYTGVGTDHFLPRIYGYTGTDAAIKVGSASADTGKFYMRGVFVDITNAGAGAIGIDILRVLDASFDRVGVNGSATNSFTCLNYDGTGTTAYTGGTLINNYCVGGAGSSTGWKFGTFSDAIEVLGGFINLSGTSTKGIYKTGSSSGITYLWGPTIQASTFCVDVDSNIGRAVQGYVHLDTGCNNAGAITFASGTSANTLITDNPTTNLVSDSGTGNSVIINGIWPVNVTTNLVSGDSTYSILSSVNSTGRGITLTNNHDSSWKVHNNLILNSATGNSLIWQDNGTQEFSVDGGGNATFNGSLTVRGTKSFRIDDPLDPERKYLYHAAVESPDMKNIYDGIATLNSKGNAVVTLPPYFQ